METKEIIDPAFHQKLARLGEDLGIISRAVLKYNLSLLDSWAEQRRKELDRGEVEAVMKAIQGLSSGGKEQKETCGKERGYFEKNKDRMRYGDFRKEGLFVGSGVVEAGCRTVIGQRLKQSGMFWTVKGANRIIALRCGYSVTAGKIFGKIVLAPKENTHKFVVHPFNGLSLTSTFQF